MKSHTGIVNFLAFNPNGKQLASCSTDLSVKLWNLETYSVAKTLTGHEHEVSAVAYLQGGDYLLSCSRDQTIKFWDTLSGFCLHTLSHGHSEWIRRITVNPASTNYFASASKDETIVIWNLEALRRKATETARNDSSNPAQDDFIL